MALGTRAMAASGSDQAASPFHTWLSGLGAQRACAGLEAPSLPVGQCSLRVTFPQVLPTSPQPSSIETSALVGPSSTLQGLKKSCGFLPEPMDPLCLSIIDAGKRPL